MINKLKGFVNSKHINKLEKLKNIKSILAVIIGTVLFFNVFYYACSGKRKKIINKTKVNQINRDNSNNYRFIFRKEIEKERKEEKFLKEREERFE